MEHNHDIYYGEIDFVIDPMTRMISNISGDNKLALRDHKSKTFVFQMPRYIEGHDVTLCNSVTINYSNTDSSTKEVFPDNFPVIDLHIDPEDDEKVLFSWTVTINATGHVGSLKFSIEFLCTDENANVDWGWGTFEHIGLTVSHSQHNISRIPQKYIDVLEQWKNSGILKDGYTPQKGVDYWTEEDKEDILQYINENQGGNGVSSWNDLSDKPFEEIVSVVPCIENIEIYVIGPESVSDYAYHSFSYANNEIISSIPVGESIIIVWDGQESKCKIEQTNSGLIWFGNNIFKPDDFTGINTDVDYPDCPIFVLKNDKGSIFLYSSSDQIGTHTLSIYKNEITLKALDEKFIPDTIPRIGKISFNSLTDLPFNEIAANIPYFENKEIYVNSSPGGYSYGELSYDITTIINSIPVGQKLIVIWDGQESECVVSQTSNGVLYFGNYSFKPDYADENVEYPDCPILVTKDSKGSLYLYAANDSNGTHILTLCSEGTATKLNEEYLPESVDGVVIRSSTSGSTKKFKLTIDDAGSLNIVEV